MMWPMSNAFQPKFLSLLKTKEMLFIAVLTLLLCAGIWYGAISTISTARADALAEDILKNGNLAELQKERVSSSMQLFDQFIITLRDDYGHHEKSGLLDKRFLAIESNQAYIGIVSIIDAKGDTVVSTAKDMSINFADRAYFKAHASDPKDQLLIGAPILGKLTGKWLISLTRRINKPDGSFGGVVFVALDPSFFAVDFEKAQIGPHSAMGLIGLDGITRVRRNNQKVSYGEDIRNSQLFKELPGAANGHYVAAAASDGQVRSVSYRTVPNYPLVIIVASSVNDIMESLRPREKIYLVTAAAGTLLALALASVILIALNTRAMRIAELEEGSERLRSIIDAAPVPMAINDQAGGILYLNPAFSSTFGYTLGDIPDLVQWWNKAYPDPEYRQWIVQTWGAEIERTKLTQTSFKPMEVNIRCKDGAIKTVQAAAASYGDEMDQSHLVTLFDTTDLQLTKQALQDTLNAKTGLLNEVHHRVKNNLQVISSLLRLESGRMQREETREVLADMMGRIRSMAMLHESLYQSGIFAQIDLAAYLKRLATESFRGQARNSGAVQLALDLSPCNVSLDQATPCALLVNELLSNCLKHAFPAGRKGTVRISLTPPANNSVSPARWSLCVSDDGIGLPEDFENRQHHSLGMQLVGDLVMQIGGILHTGPGATFTIAFAPDASQAEKALPA